jgi:formylglycine-generating enzyme required for sulfatase activity
VIDRELDAADAVIVVWTQQSIASRWVIAEADHADRHRKLVPVRSSDLEPWQIPKPYNTYQTNLIDDRKAIRDAIRRIAGLRPAAEERSRQDDTPVQLRVGAGASDQVHSMMPGGGKSEWFKDIAEGPEMVVVPQGEFLMGSDDNPDEQPKHKVPVRQPFAVGRYAVTFDEWDAAVAAGGVAHDPADSGWGRGTRPVINVSWQDAKAYVAWLSKVADKTYRLPTEAEWEYVARAGSAGPFWWGAAISTDRANYDGTSRLTEGQSKGEFRQKTLPVESFEPNPWGLYQVYGNVWEWCEDNWHASYQGRPPSKAVWEGGFPSLRVLRGGCWVNNPHLLGSSRRERNPSDLRSNFFGFRVVRLL